MGKKKVLLAGAFVAIAMLSGGVVSYEMNKSSVEVKGAVQAKIVEGVHWKRALW